MNQCRTLTSEIVLPGETGALHLRFETVQILIVRLSALTLSIIDCRFFSANYQNISHSGIWVLRTKGKHNSRIKDNGALP